MFIQKILINLALCNIAACGVMQVAKFNSHLATTHNLSLQNKLSNKTDPVTNQIAVQLSTTGNFAFYVELSNSSYNGFPGFINQIKTGAKGFNVAHFFFQWLDDNNFKTSDHFPDLSQNTKAGYYHWPFVFTTRLETHMGYFGPLTYSESQVADKMIYDVNDSFITSAENAYNHASNPNGIIFAFDFTYHSVWSKMYWGDLGHTYMIL